MLTSVRFKNFRILREAILPLTQSTLLLGPNGSGKSTALAGLKILQTSVQGGGRIIFEQMVSADQRMSPTAVVEIESTWQDPPCSIKLTVGRQGADPSIHGSGASDVTRALTQLRVFSFHSTALTAAVQLEPHAELGDDGSQLPVILTQLQDHHPEHFAALNEELRQWLPQYDRVLFDTPAPGMRGFMLRTSAGRHPIKAADLSHGTLFALAVLTLAHLPDPPELLCLEEPDRGIHPRLLRNVYDAIQRLAFPEASGDNRKPTQVICTTHSPYLLDFYRDHPEDVVLSELTPDGAIFKRLSDLPHFAEIIDNTSLGDAWYSGILGGVPAAT